MVNTYIVVGSRGIVGSQILTRLNTVGKHVLIKTTNEILHSPEEELFDSISASMAEYSVCLSEANIGLIWHTATG